MSLINDALKRAAADKPRDAQSTAATPPLQPVDSAPAKPSNILPWALLVVGVGVVGIAAGLWFGATRNTQQQAAAPQTQPTPTALSTPAAPEPTPAANPIQQTTKTLQAVAARNDDSTPTTITPVAPPAPTKNPVIVAKAPVTTAPTTTPKKVAAPTSTDPKAIRLQSIFYRMRSPTVIINGKTLGIGDSVDGIKVVSIQRTSVEVVHNGKYRTLTLQD
jgi:hypothetical protein